MHSALALEMNFWAILLIAPAIVSFWLSIETARSPYGRLGNSLSALMLAIGWWSLTYALELASTTEEGMRFWLRVEYLGIPYVPLLMYRVIRRFLGMRSLPVAVWIAIGSVPVITMVLQMTNESHGFFYSSIAFVEDDHGRRLSLAPGFWYRVNSGYAYFLAVLAVVHLVQRFPSKDYRTLRTQFSFLIIAVAGPYLGFTLYAFNIFPVQDLDLTPYFFFLSGLVLAVGIFRLQLFDLLPVAFERVFEKMADACVVVDSNDRVVMANDRAMSLFRWTTVPFAERAGDVLEPFPNLREAFASGQDERERVWEDFGGEEKILETTVSPVEDGRGRKVGRLLVLRDDTERSRMEMRTQEVLGEKDRLISIIGHDLKGSLGGLETLSSILAEEGSEMEKEELKDHLGTMRVSVAASLSLLENLLVWARIQKGEFDREPDAFFFDDVLKQIGQQMEERLLSKEIRLASDYPERMAITCDRRLFEVVFRNLLSNAIKFSRRGSVIRWDASQENGWHHFVVCDEGIGMPEEMIQDLWRLTGRQKGRQGTEGEESSGLGLVLVHEAIAEIDGNVRVESEVGKGTSVFVDIPVA